MYTYRLSMRSFRMTRSARGGVCV
eukprot:COSAG06_NODE_2832_length_6205_cov_6.623485_1_plen_23_part_10